MIGTGMAKGDIIYIDLERNSSNGARVSRSSTSTGSSLVREPVVLQLRELSRGCRRDRK